MSKITAKSFRVVLSFVIVVLIASSAFGFYIAQSWLGTLATTVGQTVAESTSSGNDIQRLQTLEKELATKQSIIQKTEELIAPVNKYQTQAIEDLSTHASRSGISISNYSFATAAPTTAPVTPGSSEKPQNSVTVSLVNPLSFSSLLKFLDAIEGNIPKMQVSTLDIDRVPDKNDGTVNIQQLIISVYTK